MANTKHDHGPTVRATEDHNGEFGFIEAGTEYPADDPLVRAASRKYPQLFKRESDASEVDGSAETAASPGRRGRETR